MSEEEKQAALLLCGYVRGLLSLITDRDWNEETVAHEAFKILGVDPKYLPKKKGGE